MDWTVSVINKASIDLEAGSYQCSLYPVDSGRVLIDLELKGARDRLRLLHTGHLDTLPLDIKGAYRRSRHRPALEALHRQWTAQGLRALAHTRYGQCGMWCWGSVCPLSTLEHSTTQQAG